jgi:hypothetical protein
MTSRRCPPQVSEEGFNALTCVISCFLKSLAYARRRAFRLFTAPFAFASSEKGYSHTWKFFQGQTLWAQTTATKH